MATTLAARGTGIERIGRHWNRYGAGYLFLLPAFLLYAVFLVYPFGQSIYLTFVEWNGADPVKRWVGLANYRALWTDTVFWQSMQNTLYYTALAVPIGIVVAMIIQLRRDYSGDSRPLTPLDASLVGSLPRLTAATVPTGSPRAGAE